MPGQLEEARAGEPDAFAAVLRPVLDPAFRLAMALLRDRGAAEDAVQEASINAWRALARMRGDESGVRPWFLAIVVNECRRVKRGRWWSVVLSDRIVITPAAQEPERLERSDLQRAFERLSLEDRAPLYLHFYLDLTHREVSRILGISEGAARSRLHRAVEHLRPHLEESAR
jgi:RNA polymerase sigma-70 factor (ECF subfamily)